MAELSCGGSCMKYILFLFNIIFFLCGGAMLGVGIWALVDDSFSDYIEIVNFEGSNPYFDHAVYMLIAIGAIIFLVGFLGCCGALCESPTMLLFFAILLGLIVVLQIAAGVLVVVFNEELGDELEAEMSEQVKYHVTNDTEDPLTAAWNVVQVEFKCCGGSGYQDYNNSYFENLTRLAVPYTCCVLNNTDPDNPEPQNLEGCQSEARNNPSSFQFLYNEGCYDELVAWIEDNAVVLIAVAFAISAIEVCGAVVLAAGIWITVVDEFDYYFSIVDFNDGNHYYDVALWILIAIGGIMFFVGFFGCCGACTENTKCLHMYAVCILIIITVQIVAGVLFIVYKEDIGSEFQDEMTTQVKRHVTNDINEPLTAAWFTLQYEFSCCGSNDYMDYWNSTYYTQTGDFVPPTCCFLLNDDPLIPIPVNSTLCLDEADPNNAPGSTFNYLHTQVKLSKTCDVVTTLGLQLLTETRQANQSKYTLYRYFQKSIQKYLGQFRVFHKIAEIGNNDNVGITGITIV